MRVTAVGILAAALLAGAAPAETLGSARFTPPAGWKLVKSEPTTLGYSHIDEAAGTYCLLGVYAATAGSGDLARDFAAEWESIVRHAFTTGPAPAAAPARTGAGVPYLAGAAKATQGAVQSYVKLLVFPVGAQVTSVLLSASSPEALEARAPAIRGFLESLRLEGAAPTGQAAPPAAAAGGPAGLTVPTPPGWQRSERDGLVILERREDLGFGQSNLFRLVFTAPVPARASALATFAALAPPLARATFASPAHPLPVRVRLRSGAALLYDGGPTRLKQGGADVTGLVYVVVHGGMAVAALGVFTGWEQGLDATVRAVFDGVRVAGASPPAREPPLFTRQELAGRWRSSSTSLASWVDGAGNYRGDASLATGETLTLGDDGTFRSQFAAVGAGGPRRSDTSGPWTIDDDTLVLSGERVTRYRITGAGRSADGRGSFLLLGVTRDDFPHLSGGSTMPRAGDLHVGAP